MDATIPWSRWAGLIEPFTYSGHRGRKPKAFETMLRIYLLQAWFSLSDEGVEDTIYDSYAMRRFLGLDFTVEQVPDATIIDAPSPVKNAAGARDLEMRQALKGNQWCFGMKAHIGVNAGTG